MKKPLSLFILLVSLVNNYLNAQQINFGGNRVMHITGSNNLFLGINTGNNISTGGEQNTFVGRNAGIGTSAGNSNAFFGAFAGSLNNSGVRNVFLGASAGYTNNGSDNTFVGTSAGNKNTTGNNNTFSGMQAGFSNTDGSNNAFFGFGAGYLNSTGISNIFIGYQAGYTNTAGQNNTIIGTSANVASNNLTNAAAFGYNARVAVSNAIVLGDASNASMKVGIGTDSPAYRLDVKGVINMRIGYNSPGLKINDRDFLELGEKGEFVVSNFKMKYQSPEQWSDKVFESDYPLKSIEEVAQYVKANKHLPNMPTAKEVTEGGIEIQTIISKLLEKIEEQTLYIEKINERLKELEKSNCK